MVLFLALRHHTEHCDVWAEAPCVDFSLVYFFYLCFFPSFPYCLWKPSPASNKGTRLEETSPFLAVEGSRSGLVWIHHQSISSLYQAISQWQQLSCKRSSLWRTQGGGSAAPSLHMESPVDEEKGCCGFQLGSWGAWSGASACCRNRAGKQALCRLDLGHNAAERGSISVVIFETGCHFQGGWFAQVITLGYCQRREYNPLLLSLALLTELHYLSVKGTVADVFHHWAQNTVLSLGSLVFGWTLKESWISPLNTSNLQNTLL